MKKNNLLLFLLVPVIFSFSSGCNSSSVQFTEDPVRFVDPFIGVADGNISNCVIGPQLPFASINPSPETRKGGHDGYSPDQPIRGFGQLHASGTGWGKYGMVFISPQTGLNYTEQGHDSPKSEETARAYEYSVRLNRYNIRVQVTPSYHSAIYRIIYPKSDSSVLVFDVTHNIPMDIATEVGGKVSEADVTVDKDGRISGHGRYSGGFGDGQYRVWFTAETSKKPVSYGVWRNKELMKGKSSTQLEQVNDRVGAYLHFNTSENDTVYLKIAVSFKSSDQSAKWLAGEIPGWDYKAVKQQAYDTWNNQLDKIKISTEDTVARKIFYTAMYHSMLMPRDRTNDMEGYKEGAVLWDDHYAAWDTWRTVFPLMVLINPAMVKDNVNSFITRFNRNHLVKDAFIAGHDMFREQGGNNVDNIIADAYVKKVPGVNWQDAYRIIQYDADSQRLGPQSSADPAKMDKAAASYKSLGWIPAGTMSCSVSLEYSYNDFCASEMANGLGQTADYKKYLDRSHKWVNLWDPELESGGYKGFICPKDENGNWVIIDPAKNWGSWHNYFYEANSWTYSYFVPHDFPKLVDLCGGATNFSDRLSYGLEHNLIGYDNEPAFLAIQSFHYSGRPDLASYWVKKMMREKYTEKGYPGNEDSGAMSSWYVFAALRLFPECRPALLLCQRPGISRDTGTTGQWQTTADRSREP